MVQLYVILPVGGGGQIDNTLPGQQPGIDNSLPGGQGGRPSHPIYHPGHPDHGLPAHPDQGLPGGSGGRPDQGLPPFPSQGLPPGGEDIPSNELPMPQPPADHADDIIVAVHRPGLGGGGEGLLAAIRILTKVCRRIREPKGQAVAASRSGKIALRPSREVSRGG